MSDSRARDPNPNDPRLAVYDDAERAEIARQADAVVALRHELHDALHRGEPVVIPRWRLDNYTWAGEWLHIPWFVDGSVDALQVSPDDTVVPVSR